MYLRALMLKEDYQFWQESFGEIAEPCDKPAVASGKKHAWMVEYRSDEASGVYDAMYYFIETKKPLIAAYGDAEDGSIWIGATLNGHQASLPLRRFGHTGELTPVVSTGWLTTTPDAASVKNNDTFNHLYHILLVEEFGVCEPEEIFFFDY